ncbi:kelch-like protein 24 [Mytilus edulis]|uniref:KLHL29 n=1 Tax=Mytilus edulis TaxID=6550 RepID=A0A8S3RC81_MYTED|nr:KBTBD9 [Mytilus edulis]
MEPGKMRYLDTLTDGLDNLLSTGQHSDIEVIVDDRSFHCHKVILSAMSPYFEAMFSHDMRENRDGVVKLYDIEADIFEKILQFLYTGKDVVSEENAEMIFRAASLMQIPCLQATCADFLLTQVSPDNCIGIWKIAQAHNCEKLKQTSFMFILENFQVISTTEDFLNLDLDELVGIINSDHLITQSEELVCDIAMEWINHDKESRQNSAGKILEVLRLPLLSASYLCHTFESNQYLQNDPECKTVIQEAMKYHTCPTKRQDFTSHRSTHRYNSKTNDCIIIIGGLLSTTPRYQTTKEVLCYSFQQEKWFNLPSLPYDPGYEFATCTYGSSIFVSGGWLKLQGLAEYKTHKNKWKVCPQMTNGRCGHVMVSVNNSIFVLGGRDGVIPAMTNIEEYNLLTNKWTTVGDLPLGVRSTSAAAIGEKIYVFGGIIESDKDTMSVQCFDTRHHTVTVCGDLPFSCRLTRTFALDTAVYVMAPDGRVIQFCDSSLNIITKFQARRLRTSSSGSDSNVIEPPNAPTTCHGKLVCKLPNFSQHHFEVVQYRGHILLVGGKTPDNTILKNIMVADIHDKGDTNDLFNDLEMPSARWCFGCIRAIINKDFLNNELYV